ncbi:hypothetical protein [Nostoc punctiforme]|uniref:Uncharacterized protein n=2 Tax=Nostoc punctiforme TaxID=272131 RepID=B2J9U9_NOSP7|nr:hypothetical protein [Nostoc punctiforme]ACC81126.1 hypothetical protein Npun_F2572 [Nostoc punctiforme PCC 73102]RCJ41932.1 hypothetical protein A6769_38575 [Nostoc punctiforme NIES-2108]
MLTRENFEACIQELESFYNGTILNGGILESVWYKTLKHLPLEKLQSAIAGCFKKHPRQYNFFPSAGQILDFANFVGGEYREPGESILGDFSLPILPSVEERLTPEQKAELNKRGRLQARIIVNAQSWMTPEQKDALVEQLKLKETHELEAIASTSARLPRRPKFNNLSLTIKNLEQELGIQCDYEEEEVTSEVKASSYDTRAIARQWLEGSR